MVCSLVCACGVELAKDIAWRSFQQRTDMEETNKEKRTAIGALVFGDEFLAQGLHLQSHQRC